MPLLTDELDQARRAYGALEARARNAEERAEKLQADRARLVARQSIDLDTTGLLRQRVLDLEGENFKLREQVEQLARLRSDLSLKSFIGSVGLAAALGEASMPERAIPSIKAEVQTFISPIDANIGLRFQQPELGALAVGLSSTSFEIVKVPPRLGTAAPPNLYMVLQEMQRVYTDEFWLRFEEGAQIVAEIARALSNSGAWNVQYLVQTATRLAVLQKPLVALIADVAPAVTANDYGNAVEALRSLTNAQGLNANLVAADVYALASALESTTKAARSLIP